MRCIPVIVGAIVLISSLIGCSESDRSTADASSETSTTSEGREPSEPRENIDPVVETEPDGPIVWTGEPIEFEKADGADPTLPENQDRITDSVWITRPNDGGQIFNIKVRQSPSKGGSPLETEWAEGGLDEIDSLRFRPFRAAVVQPKEVVGKELVLHIIPEDIYLSVEFTSWSEGKRGGFSYRRGTP